MDFRTYIFMSNFLTLFLMMISSNTSAVTPVAKPGCEDQASCGNIAIPFPFGTREGCYMNESFFVACRHSSRVFLGDSEIEITNISLEPSQLRILYDVGYDCYGPKHKGGSLYNYTGPEMYLSDILAFNNTVNKFTAIGCDTYATVAGVSTAGEYRTGCISVCKNKESVVDGACSGIGCCKTSIPEGAWQINITLDSYENHTDILDFNPCSYAFVIEEAAFQFFADNLTNIDKNSSFPVVVDWVAEYNVTCALAWKNMSSYTCKADNSECYDQKGAIGYKCRCKDGFEGNPYLQTGCEDIDECANSALNDCAKYSSCENSFGSYTCKCNEGYYGNGRKNGDQCQAKNIKRNIGYWPVIGVSIGSAVLLAFSFFYSKLMKRKASRLREEFFEKNGGLLLQQKLNGRGDNSYTARIFTVKELQSATNNFDENHVVGRGGFGIVFRGELPDKKVVAIKKSRGVDEQQVEQFINEVLLLSQINNRNVVKLLGCCLETEVPLLVYEFIDNGTLYDHLHNMRSVDASSSSRLSWNIRLRIATEVAGVLSYLHSVAFPPIIHRDIKSANILLDQNYTAKVADFGISRLLPAGNDHVATMVLGTHGYLDPEYLQTGILTEKSDVYSFGIVLMELLTGKKVLASDRPEGQRFLSNYFLSAIQNGHLNEIFDDNISRDENMGQLEEAAMIAKKCISVNGEDRPYMKEVAWELETLGRNTQQFIVEGLDVQNEGTGNATTIDSSYSVCSTITEHDFVATNGFGR